MHQYVGYEGISNVGVRYVELGYVGITQCMNYFFTYLFFRFSPHLWDFTVYVVVNICLLY